MSVVMITNNNLNVLCSSLWPTDTQTKLNVFMENTKIIFRCSVESLLPGQYRPCDG